MEFHKIEDGRMRDCSNIAERSSEDARSCGRRRRSSSGLAKAISFERLVQASDSRVNRAASKSNADKNALNHWERIPATVRQTRNWSS